MNKNQKYENSKVSNQDTYPAPGHTWVRFFRNQEKLTDLRIQQDLSEAMKDADP